MERNGKGVNGNGRKPTPDPSLKGREQEVSPSPLGECEGEKNALVPPQP